MIKLDNVEIKYGNNVIIDDLDLEIKSGEFVTIIGKTGCGKTSLLNVMSMLARPSSGDVTLCGIKNPRFNSKDGEYLLKHKIGLIFQNNVLIEHETVADNIQIAVTDNGYMSMQESLEFVGLSGFEDRYIYTLSGGEQQRVALCRVLVKDFEIIFGDEITGSLDDNTRDSILMLLDKLSADGKTIILVTHDIDVANHSNRIIDLGNINKMDFKITWVKHNLFYSFFNLLSQVIFMFSFHFMI